MIIVLMVCKNEGDMVVVARRGPRSFDHRFASPVSLAHSLSPMREDISHGPL